MLVTGSPPSNLSILLAVSLILQRRYSLDSQNFGLTQVTTISQRPSTPTFCWLGRIVATDALRPLQAGTPAPADLMVGLAIRRQLIIGTFPLEWAL